MSGTTGTRRRPILVWLIFLFYLVTGLLGIVQLFYVTAGGVPLRPEQQAYLNNFSVFDRVVGYVNVALTLLGVTWLLALRRLAVPVLALAFALNVFSTAVVWIRSDFLRLVSIAGLVVQCGGMALFGCVVLYAWWLARRGVLSGKRASATRPRK